MQTLTKAVLLLSALSVPLAQAAEEAKTSHWSGESDLSYLWKSGNTKSEALNAKQKVVFDKAPWKNTLVLEASNGSSTVNGQKERIDERYFASDQVDYLFSKKTYAFARGSAEKNRFSGFEHRANAIAGIGQQFIKNDKVDFKGEIGVGHAIEKRTDQPKRDSGTVGYLSEDLAWNMSKTAQLGQSLRHEYTSFNSYTEFGAYVKTMLVANISMKVSYTLRYNSDVPATAHHKDEEVTIGLNYSF